MAAQKLHTIKNQTRRTPLYIASLYGVHTKMQYTKVYACGCPKNTHDKVMAYESWQMHCNFTLNTQGAQDGIGGHGTDVVDDVGLVDGVWGIVDGGGGILPPADVALDCLDLLVSGNSSYSWQFRTCARRASFMDIVWKYVALRDFYNSIYIFISILPETLRLVDELRVIAGYQTNLHQPWICSFLRKKYKCM